jgi:hypothetical protein
VANALQKLEQKDDLDKYIANFNNLRKAVKWAQNDEGTMLFFWRGLKTGLLTERLKDGSNPTTLLDWQKLAIKKHSAYLNLRHKLETQKDTPKWAQVMMKKKPPKEHKDPFAMDVDAIRAGTMDKDKKDKLQKGRKMFLLWETRTPFKTMSQETSGQ